jgi:hypothetical protein
MSNGVMKSNGGRVSPPEHHLADVSRMVGTEGQATISVTSPN